MHSPVFLVLPPEVTSQEYQATGLTATAYDSQKRVQKILIRKLKILGVSKMCPSAYSTLGGGDGGSKKVSGGTHSPIGINSIKEVWVGLLYKLCTRFCEYKNTR